jgi:hypothetical protein
MLLLEIINAVLLYIYMNSVDAQITIKINIKNKQGRKTKNEFIIN